MGETMAEVEKIDQELPEVSPPGWEGSVKAMKKHKDIDNPWALAWHMKNKGDKPHYKDQDGKPEKKAKYKNEEVETGDIVLLNEKHDCAEVHPDVSHEDWVDQKDEDMSLAPKGKGRKAAKALYKEDDIDELSTDLLGRYKTKAAAQASAADKKGNFKKADKRFSGITRATNKQFANDAKKEEVEIEENGNHPPKGPHKHDPKKTLKITKAGEKALKKGDQKLSITAKGRAALEKAEALDLKKIRAHKRIKAAGRMKDIKKVFNKKTKPTKDVKVPPRMDAPDRGYFEELENEEMQFKVKLKGLPSFYVPAKSAATVKAMLRKQMRRPDDIESIDRVTKSAKKRDFRLRVQGKDQNGE